MNTLIEQIDGYLNQLNTLEHVELQKTAAAKKERLKLNPEVLNDQQLETLEKLEGFIFTVVHTFFQSHLSFNDTEEEMLRSLAITTEQWDDYIAEEKHALKEQLIKRTKALSGMSDFYLFFNKTAFPLEERLNVLFSQDQAAAVVVSKEDELRIIGIYKELTLIIIEGVFNHNKHQSRHTGYTGKHLLSSLLPLLLELLVFPSARKPIKLNTFFDRLPIYLSGEMTSEIKQMIFDWYQKNNLTFVHDNISLNLEFINHCIYMLNSVQTKLLYDHFYHQITRNIANLKLDKMRHFSAQTKDKLQKYKKQSLLIESWIIKETL
jgi:hypothetical protein